MRLLKRMRARMRPSLRQWLDGFGIFFVVTLLFCLLQSAHDGIVNRNPTLDQYRWWYPIYEELKRHAIT